MIKLIIFDFDGTLVDTRKLVISTIEKVFKEYEYKIPKNLRSVARLGDSSIKGTFKPFIKNKKDLEEMSRDFIREKTKLHKKTILCKGAKNLKKIKKKKIVVSNSYTSFLRAVIKSKGIDFFSRIYGADKFSSKGSQIKNLVKRYKLNPSEVICVGDRAIDVQNARKLGCISVIISNECSWGTRREVLAKKPDFIISDLDELKKILNKIG